MNEKYFTKDTNFLTNLNLEDFLCFPQNPVRLLVQANDKVARDFLGYGAHFVAHLQEGTDEFSEVLDGLAHPIPDFVLAPILCVL